jgi:hypothetical protein
MKLYGIIIPPTPRGEWNNTAYIGTDHFAALWKAGIVTQCDADKHTTTILGTEAKKDG